MADITINDLKELVAFMKKKAGIETFVIFYHTVDTDELRYAYAKTDPEFLSYVITASAEIIGKENAHIAVEMAGEVPNIGNAEFIPESEN